ncbi:MAG TPA: RidA family protein [Thermoanaerobaculia bacterium]|nr:RidA family protein [Thermoanaerobaculia bacterium]
MSTRREFLATAVAVAATATSVRAATKPMTKSKKQSIQFIASAAAPKAIGPYSQAVRAGNTLYASGQIPLDPATGNLVEGDFTAQARRVLENLKAVLHEAGADFRDVVKATVYLPDLGNFQTLNTIYGEYFGDHKPARSTVGVAALPRGAMVEIDLVAVM